MPLEALSTVVGYGQAAAAAYGRLQAALPRSANPGFGIAATLVDGVPVAVREHVVAERPFCRLLHFRREIRRRDPRVLLIAPLSGQFASMLRDMVVALLPGHEVYVTDWLDAREVPAAQGRFDFADNIDYVMDFIRALGPDLHLIGLCQSAVPTLAATALLAQAGVDPPPPSLTLISGLIDPRIRPTRVERLLAARSLGWFERNVISIVPSGYPGHRRRVYPGNTQLSGLLIYLARHMRSGDELYRKVTDDDGADPVQHPFRRYYAGVMDLPAEFFLDLVRTGFQDFALPRRRLSWRGDRVDLGAIRRTALLTIEGALDDISAPGQTEVAHSLCENIPDRRRGRIREPGVGHYGTFHGRLWRAAIAPQIADFIRMAAA